MRGDMVSLIVKDMIMTVIFLMFFKLLSEFVGWLSWEHGGEAWWGGL